MHRNILKKILDKKDLGKLILDFAAAAVTTDLKRTLLLHLLKIYSNIVLFNFIRNTSVFNPRTVVSKPANELQTKIKKLLSHLTKLDILIIH